MGPLVGATELSKALIEAGNNLLKPHSSTEEILSLLDRFLRYFWDRELVSAVKEIESLLLNVEQDPSVSVQRALIPSMKALVSADLLRNPDSDVRVFVVSCLTEIMRITAPEAPYTDDQMKEIFQVTIEAFGKLADASCHSYRKAEAVLDTVSKVRSSLVMLDLECDDLILEMFRQFLKIISPDHPQVVLLAMETIMITVIDESEEVSTDLLDILLASVKKDSQDVSPMASKLVEKVLSICTCKLQPCIMEALRSTGTSLDMYSPVVFSICQSESATTQPHHVVDDKENEADEKKSKEQVVPSDSLEDKLDLGISRKGNRSKRTARGGTRRANGDDKTRNGNDLKQLLKQGQSESTDAETESGSTRKRGRKPNSLMNPEEGYSFKTSSSKKMQEKEVGNLSLGKLAAKKASSPSKVGQTNQSVVISLSPSSRARTGSRKRSRSKMEETILDVGSLATLTSNKQIPKKEAPDEEDFMESDLEKPDNGIKTAKSSKKEKAQNGSAKTSAKKPHAETKMVKTSEKKVVHSDVKKKNSESRSKDTPTPQSSKNKKKNSRATTPSTKESEQTPKSQPKRKRTAGEEKKNSRATTPSTKESEQTPKSQPKRKRTAGEEVKKNSRATTPLTKESEQTPKSHPKRKRTAGEELESRKKELGEELVGKRVNVWWPLDEEFYEGVIQSYCIRKKTHQVAYSDGDVENLNLKKERWDIIPDSSSVSEIKEIDLPESLTLLDLVRRQKAKKSKNVSMNVELSSSSEVRSSMQKKDSVPNSTKQAKRTKGGLKAVSNEPESREAKNLKSLEELNAESGRRRGRSEKRQKVTQAMNRESEKDCDEKEEPETKGEDSLKFEKESNAELECKRDHQELLEGPNAATETDREELQSTTEPIAEPETDGGDERISVKESNVEPKTDGEEWEAAKEPIAGSKTYGEEHKVAEEPTAEPKNGEESKVVKEPTAELKADGEEHKSLKELNAEPETDGEERKSVREPNAEPETEAKEQESAKEPTADTTCTEKEDMYEEKRHESDRETYTSVSETGKVENEAEEDDQMVVKELEEESDKAEVVTIPGSG
ncbi:unnamed protein product [Arabis nemorensis]|uniref:Tudor domain-containing protein n=1 Tax=Arabis nemorensis TaxID=586526 RepID=A0A565AQ05_9BRAS|nr:unnamed protein product [Arabis nemorensis]